MATLKRLIFFYLINLVVYAIVFIVFGNGASSVLMSSGLWVLTLFPVILGQVIGFLIYVSGEQSLRSNKVFWITISICSLIFSSLIFYLKFSEWKHQKYYGNIESNADYFKYWINNYQTERKIAFDTLVNKYETPNSIKLNGSSVNSIDTIIDGEKSKIYNIQFTYIKNNENQYKANLIVFRGRAHLIYYDKYLTKDDIIQIESCNKKVLDGIKDDLKKMPDSIRYEIEREFKEVL